ncbi:MAG: RsmD family RNA methyltransferase [Deltaproteobacteria bacterium]|nr:RsmD family RNA methyltransferase [Deltaproteobacteria bacterium]
MPGESRPRATEPRAPSSFQRDALAAYKGLPQARVVFCDPPYDKGWLEKIVAAEAAAGRIVEGGLFLYEARDKEALPAETPTLRHYDTKNYGDSSVHYFVKLPA